MQTPLGELTALDLWGLTSQGRGIGREGRGRGRGRQGRGRRRGEGKEGRKGGEGTLVCICKFSLE